MSLLLANFLHKRKPYLTTFGKPFISAKPTVLADNSLILLNCFLSARHVPGQPRSRFAVRTRRVDKDIAADIL